jgi:N-acetylmuramic acid 6-phosphate etherase
VEKRITEQDSLHRNLETKSTMELLQGINSEDRTVAESVAKKMDQVAALVDAIYEKMRKGGRLFYIGSGTSGRLGILDASECPPTFGVPQGMVIGLIAGGDAAIRQAQEGAEDDMSAALRDLQEYGVSAMDVVVGISASGTTPYVLGGLADCRRLGIKTGCIVCNEESDIALVSDYAIEVVVGPEFLTGSTRMKSGTAQKLVLNMITTSVMIKLGRVKDNKMVDMQLTNRKLVDRGTRMLMNLYSWKYDHAKAKLLEHGSVRAVMLAQETN